MRLTCCRTLRLVEAFPGVIDHLIHPLPSAVSVRSSRRWAPALNVVENDRSYVLTADLPGVDRGGIDIRLDNSVLTITGERTPEHAADPQGYRCRERPHGLFLWRYALSDSVDSTDMSAHVNDGVLVIILPKRVEATPRKIVLN